MISPAAPALASREAADVSSTSAAERFTITVEPSQLANGNAERIAAAQHVLRASRRAITPEGCATLAELAAGILHGDHSYGGAPFASADWERTAIVAHILARADKLNEQARTSFDRLATAIGHGRHQPPEKETASVSEKIARPG
jgi:hypothetical protein